MVDFSQFSLSGAQVNHTTILCACLPNPAGDGEAEPTSAAAAIAAANTTNEVDGTETDGSNGKMPKVGQDGNGKDDGDNTLWEQMTAREGRDAARRAGMSVGDWQAERQLQEALRDSVQVNPCAASAAPAVG